MTAGSLAFLFGICPSAGIYKRLIRFSGRLWVWFWSRNGINRRRVGLWHGDLFNDRYHRNFGFDFRSSRFRCRRFCFCSHFRGFCLGNGCKFRSMVGRIILIQLMNEKESQYNHCCQNKKNGNQQTNQYACFFRLFRIDCGGLCWRLLGWQHKGLLGWLCLFWSNQIKLTAAVITKNICDWKLSSAVGALLIGIHGRSSFGT